MESRGIVGRPASTILVVLDPDRPAGRQSVSQHHRGGDLLRSVRDAHAGVVGQLGEDHHEGVVLLVSFARLVYPHATPATVRRLCGVVTG